MNINVDDLWERVRATHAIALDEWVNFFGDENAAKDEISNTLMDESMWNDPNRNFLLRLISDGQNGYRRPRVQLALTFVKQMAEFDPRPEIINFLRSTLRVQPLPAGMQRRGNGLIHEAAKSGRCAIFEKLRLLTVQNVNYLNNIGESALHLAAEFEHPEDVRILLDAGAEFKVCVMLLILLFPV